MHNHEGLLYIATGDDYVNEAINNMQRSRPFIGSRKSCIVTDRPSPLLYTVFDIVKKHPFPTFSYEDKILPLLDLPFKRTLFLDTDACLISPIDETPPDIITGHFDISATFIVSLKFGLCFIPSLLISV